jgi:hypothetical protein
MELVRAMKAKRGAAYREYKEWLGEHYNASAFDLAEVNRQLAKTNLWQ